MPRQGKSPKSVPGGTNPMIGPFNLCSDGDCCPQVGVIDGTVFITDDDGGTVTLSGEEFKHLLRVSGPQVSAALD